MNEELEKAARQALEAIEAHNNGDWDKASELFDEALPALRRALEQPAQQEPLACVHIKDGCLVGSHRDQNKPFPDGQYGLWPIDTRHHSMTPLTDEQIADLMPDDDMPMSLGEAFVKFARLVEAHHGIGEKK